ncbi:ATP-binding cassette long-chain fatty acid transporter pxa1 [Coemansia sp. RSA 2320]|nr:ATP-binding cassette long-chain fatty acid transporter pxa1 [Coemansia sp. RSA 2320]
MPAVGSKHSSRPATAGLPVRSLGAAALASLVVVVYSYVQHRRTSDKAKRSMALSAALSSASMRSLRGASGGGAYAAGQWTEGDERERKFDQDAPYFPASPATKDAVPGSAKPGGGKLDRAFLQQLRALTRIIVPSLASKEVAIIAMHAAFLVLRTWLSVVVADLDGKIVKHLVRGQGRRFLAGLLSWFAIAIPATYTNSMIRFLESKLALAFRTRLTQYVHDLYLNDNLSYYKLLALDARIANPDQFITADIARFCNKLASFLSNLAKPTLDTIVFNIQLIRGVGLQGTLGMFAVYMATASLLRAWTPAFGKMAAAHAELEGDFRTNHSRLITNAEEIAFYRGEPREEEQLHASLARLLRHARAVARRKISHVVLEDMIIKYTWSAFGYLACALPFFLRPAHAATDSGYRTQRFVTNKRILVNLSDAGGRMMYSIKEVMELTGYTTRVYSLISTLHALRRDEFEPPNTSAAACSPPDLSLRNIQGVVYEDIDGIRFTAVPIVAPSSDPSAAGELLVNPLTWEVRRGQHWMIAGPNGVGKTSVLRVLSGLWPAFSGVVERPEPSEIFYIPQRPYLSLGSLRDQVTYPHTYDQVLAAGRTDDELMEILQAVHLSYLPAREGGFDARKEWKDVLSGGEKQRINLARLFYHLPRFAVLDECTSAVSADVEGLMYEHAKLLGITLITISHRPALYKYHTLLLSLNARIGSNNSNGSSSTSLGGDDVTSAVGSYDHSLLTESWTSDIAEFSIAADAPLSGVLWDVVQLTAGSDDASSPASSPAATPALPLQPSVPAPAPAPAPTPAPAPALGLAASVSSADLARKGSMAAIRLEVEQLRAALVSKKEREEGLKQRLGQVQQELATVVL